MYMLHYDSEPIKAGILIGSFFINYFEYLQKNKARHSVGPLNFVL